MAVRHSLLILWFVLRDRPVVRCPACKGQGGAVEGYFEREFCECQLCWKSWKRLDDYGYEWAMGRIDPLRWPRAKFFSLTGRHRFWQWARCRARLHKRDAEGFCVFCYDWDGRDFDDVEPGEGASS